MVSTASMITIGISLCVTLILPILVYVVYCARNKGKGVFTAWLLGAAGFVVCQILIRIPILNILSLSQGFMEFAEKHYVWYCLVLAFTAALFEVAGRYGVAKLLKERVTYERSFAAGLGHGSIEAMLLVGVTYINNLTYSMMINTGSFDTVIEQVAAMGVDAAPYEAMRDTLINTPSLIFLLGGYERILTVILHIALTMIVCYFVSCKKDMQGILICVGIHWTVDFVNPLISGLATEYLGNMITTEMSYVMIYIFLTAVAVASVMVIRRLKARWVEQDK